MTHRPAAWPRADAARVLAVAAAIAPLAALGLYLLVGSPQTPDQPFARRLTAWRAADPTSLDAEQLTAVLQLITRQRPGDPQARYFLARAQLASGDPFSAIHSLRHAIDLAPRDGDLWTALGEIEMAQAGGDATPEALERLPPGRPGRSDRARARAISWRARGSPVAMSRAAWPTGRRWTGASRRTIRAARAWSRRSRWSSAPTPCRKPMAQTADAAAPTHGPSSSGMVEGLAARLKAQPDDPAGWGRLIRSYAVLGDEPRRAAALATARALFKARPADLRLVEQAASRPQ